MDKKTLTVLIVGVLVGVVVAPKLHSLPVLNKIPQV